MHRQKHKKSFSLIICFILILNLVLGITTVYATGNTIVLNGPDKSEVQTFTVNDMFPGDRFSQDYDLYISEEEDIEIFFKAKILDGYGDRPEEKGDLAEVLKFKVEIPGEEILYNDEQNDKELMKDMPEQLTYTVPAGQEKVKYRLTVYLDTSVGDEYQNKELRADFEWYYMIESSGGGEDPDNPGGGGGEDPDNPGGGGGEDPDNPGGGGGEDPDNPGGGGGEDPDYPGGGSGNGSGSGSIKPGTGTTKLLRRAYVVGRPNNYFEPEAPITRAETATIFARIFADYNEGNLISTDTKFKDVANTAWFAKYISRCEDENIIFGYEGYFRPSDNITRAEFAAICVRFFENRSESTISPKDIAFTDFESSHWAYDTIKKAYANGYVVGYPDGTLKADNTITRAEAVTIVNRMLERIPDKEYIDNNLHKLIDFVDVRDKTYWAYYEIFEAANTHFIRFVNNFAKWVD
ncbi:MAG: S-layer homology domain-containing protein [Clostridia bacterium]|nr:S-layer homology domain-containing protein [Clostridia bacterium]